MKHEILVYNKTLQKIPKKFIVQTILKTLAFLKLKQPGELAVLIVDRNEIKRLNYFWRGKNQIVDELSFGLNSREIKIFGKLDSNVVSLGEIVINVDKISERKGLSKILIHALMHLLGYHHEKSAAEAKKTEKIERQVLEYLNINLEIRN